MKNLLILSFISVVLIASCGGSKKVTSSNFQFEEYKWGTTMTEIKERVESLPGFEVKYGSDSINTNFISYKTEIFDECEVTFSFTKASGLLYGVSLDWDKARKVDKELLAKEIFEALTEKYGPPQEKDESSRFSAYNSRYWWKKGDESLEFSSLILLSHPRVYYGNDKIYIQGEIESEDLKRKKINRDGAKRL